ncbi:MAG: hypothetical protein O2960_10845 [Verrucomicrobia bacterium]|nr:hypothetical protein [Verrucomicrobiota bacterium]
MIGIPYRFYLGIKNEFFDFIEQNRVFDSLGEDLGKDTLLRNCIAVASGSLTRFEPWIGLRICESSALCYQT